MANTYYDSKLTAEEIEAALEAIDGVIVPANNGKVLAINNGKIEARSVQWGGGEAVVQPLSVTQNGTYNPPSGVDGYSPVTVNVSGGGTIDKSKQNSSLGGNCYIKEGKITGFSSATSIWQPKDASNSDLIVDWSQPFKIHVNLTLNNTYSGSQALYGANASNVYFVLPTCEIRTNSFWFGFTTNGSSWTDEISITTIPVVANSNYEIDIVYDGTKITATISDGTNSETDEITPLASLYNDSTKKIGFGGIARNSSLIARYVMFDPDDTYIESNGVVVWGTKS